MLLNAQVTKIKGIINKGSGLVRLGSHRKLSLTSC